MDRSEVMRRVKSRNTTPEMIARRLAHSLGYRFRLHRRDLPGKPDLTFASRRCVIFVHGCFWHGHDCLRGARMPKTNVSYWRRKIERNRERDAEAKAILEADGWHVLPLWECGLKDRAALARRLVEFLGRAPRHAPTRATSPAQPGPGRRS